MKTGIDTLGDQNFDLLRGRRVGLLSHRAAIAADGRETAEILHEAVNLVALFGPEHGFQGRALAGEATPSFEHPEWRIPVHSLYGATREPSPEMLAGVDCVVCDLQDLGVRCYTYLATLRNMMRACERAGKTLWINIETGELHVDGFADYEQRFGRKTHVNSPKTAKHWRVVPPEKLRAKVQLAREYTDTTITWGYREYWDPMRGEAARRAFESYLDTTRR